MWIAPLRRRTVEPAQKPSAPSPSGGARPAAAAAARVSHASLLLGGLGVATAVFVLMRVLVVWHVTPHSASHHISLLGQRLSYPTANAGAIVLIVLAAWGLAVAWLATRGVLSEVAAARRFQHWLTGHLGPNPGSVRGALVIVDERPQVFCAGLVRPRVYISTGALAALDEPSLNAVLAHERHHARHHDPLRLATGRVLARALFLVPGIAELARRQQALAELGADEHAFAASPAHRSALASAMLRFSDASGPVMGIDPARVDFLLGESPSWRFPLVLCLSGAMAIALFLATAVLVGRVAYGSATLAPPFLSRQPCVIMLAIVPAVVTVLAALRIWGRRDPPAAAPTGRGASGQRSNRRSAAARR